MKVVFGLTFIFAAASAFSQVSGGGEAGGGGSAGTTITYVDTLTETWSYPEYDGASGVWRQKSLLHTKAGNQENWTVDGVVIPPPFSVAIPTGWTQAPPSSSGYTEAVLVRKFKLKLPAGQNTSSVWVAVSSTALALGMGGGRVVSANNGQADDAFDDGTEMTSTGKHLRKVSINSEGEGEWTVTCKAKSSGTGSGYTFAASVGASLARDPRSIALPAMYKKKPGEANAWYGQSYMALDGEFLTTGGQPYGWVPKKKVEAFGITYTTATREVIEPVSTDALSIKLNAKLALPPVVIKGEWVANPFGDMVWIPVGSRLSPFPFGAAFAGCDYTMRPVQKTGTHDSASQSETQWFGDDGSLWITSTKLADTLDYFSPTSPGNPAQIQGDSSGSFKAEFSFQDGVKGKAEATLIYLPAVVSSEASTMPFCFNASLSVADVFTFGTGWSDSENIDAAVSGLGANGYQDQVMLANGILSALALTAAMAGFPEFAIPLSVMEILGSSALDSSHDFGTTTRNLDRWTPKSPTDKGEFWSVSGLPSIYPSTESWLTAVKASRWRVVCAPYGKLTLHARDFYDTTGFVKRAPAHFWETKGAGQCGNDWKKWYIFEYNDPQGSTGGGQ